MKIRAKTRVVRQVVRQVVSLYSKRLFDHHLRRSIIVVVALLYCEVSQFLVCVEPTMASSL